MEGITVSSVVSSIVQSSVILVAIVVGASILLTIIIIVLFYNYEAIGKFAIKFVASLFTSILWATYDTVTWIVSVISFIIAIPFPFNLIAILIIALVFVAAIAGLVLIGPISAIFNNVVQLGITTSNSILVDGRDSIAEPILTPSMGYTNIFTSTVSEVSEEFFDYMCPDGVLLDCKGVDQVKFMFDMYIQYWIYVFGLIGQLMQAFGIIFKEFLCNGKILTGGLDEYGCLIGNPLKAIPRVYLQHNARGPIGRGVLSLASIVIPQSFKTLNVPLMNGRPIDLVDIEEEYHKIINQRFKESSTSRRQANATLTPGGFDLSDSSQYLTYYYLETTGLWPWIQLFLIIMADILDVFWNFIVEYLMLAVVTIMVINLLFIKYTLLGFSIIAIVFGNVLFSFAFLLRGVIAPDVVLDNLNSTLPVRNVEYVDTGLSKIVMNFLLGYDPIELLIANNETGWLPPGSPEVREVVIDIIRLVEDLIVQILVNIPYILMFIDKSLCVIQHPTQCAADYQLCKILFDDTAGVLSPIIQATDLLGNWLIIISNVLVGPIFGLHTAVTWLYNEVIRLLVPSLPLWEYPIWTIPTTWSTYAFENTCELAFYQSGAFCICSACRFNASAVSPIVPAMSWGLSNGAPCLPLSEERCCLIASPDYKIYDDLCIYRTGSTYTSLFFFFFPATFEPYTTEPQLPFRCHPWGAVIETYDRMGTFGYDNSLIGATPYGTLTVAGGTEFVFHISPLHAAKGRHPFGYEREQCDNCPDSHKLPLFLGLPEDMIPLICSDLGFSNFLVGDADVAPIHGCMFYIHSLSNCYGEFYAVLLGPGSLDDKDFASFWLHQNLICPDGYKVAQFIDDAVPTETFRSNYMCTIMESWITEVRDSYMFHMFQEKVDGDPGVPNPNTWASETTSPMRKIQPQAMILDFLDNKELFCEMNGMTIGCVEALTDMVFDFSDIRDYDVCNSLLSSYEQQLFPNKYTDDMYELNESPPPPINFYKNPYRYKWESLYKHHIRDTSTNDMYRRFCEYLALEPEVTASFESSIQVEQYFDLLSQDPRNMPIDRVVVKLLNSLNDEFYPWQSDKGLWPCNPSSPTQNSDMYHYEHVLTPHYMAMEHFLYNKRFSGAVLEHLFKTHASTGKNQGDTTYFCNWLTYAQIYWSCNVTQFYEDPDFSNLINWDYDDDINLNKVRYPFLKFLFGDLRRNYASLGDPGEFVDTAVTINWVLQQVGNYQDVGSPTGDGSWISSVTELAISFILQQLHVMYDSGLEPWTLLTWKYEIAANHGITNVTLIDQINAAVDDEIAADIDSAVTNCKGHGLVPQFCNSIGWGMKNDTEFRDCVFMPYTNKPADCVSMWYEKFWNFGEGLKIKNIIPTFEYARDFG